jgi:uncharacterized DUF497 family protein
MDFDWDTEKAETNLKKHNVSFQEAATAFEDDNALEMPDTKHSGPFESRIYLIGTSLLDRVLLLVFTEREFSNGEKKIRIISCRQANRKERQIYAENR